MRGRRQRRNHLLRFVDGRFAPLHGQCIQLDRGRNVPDRGLPTDLDPVNLGRGMLVLGRGNCLVRRAVLGLLDARTLGRVLFIAQLERDGEAFLVRRARLSGQPVLMLALVVTC